MDEKKCCNLIKINYLSIIDSISEVWNGDEKLDFFFNSCVCSISMLRVVYKKMRSREKNMHWI